MSDSSAEISTSSQNAREVTSGYGAALVILKPHEAGPFRGRHPWVFDSAIDRIEGGANDGDVVELDACGR